jgi:hypothetical protein
VRTIAIAAALACGILPQAARATTLLCVDVRADDDAAGLRKLAEDELAHHRTHHVVQSGCASRLTIELFAAAGTRYLTLRVNDEVPVRFAIKAPHDLEERLSEGLRQVLKNDPVYLAEDMSRMNAVWRAGANIVRHGVTRYRAELFEIVGGGGGHTLFASGAACTVARGFEHLQVFARVEAAGSATGGDVSLRAFAGADLGVLYEVSARANNTFYLGPGVALHFLRLEGPSGAAPANALLFSVALRTGFRFLRFYGFDVDLFAQLHLPLHKTTDPDSPLIDAYTPFAQLGLGVGF